MKRWIFVLVLSSLCGYSEEKELVTVSKEMENIARQFSRREGYRIAQSLRENAEWIDLQAIIEGINDYASGKKALASLEGGENSFDVAIKLFEAKAQNNLEIACTFLQKVSSKPTVHDLENGKLLYEVLQEGRGSSSVQKDSAPLLQYCVWTLDGKTIVTTRTGMGAHPVPLCETIPGFAKGVEGMREKERRLLYIHPELGYALFGHIAPNSLLIVDVEVEALNQMHAATPSHLSP